MIKEDVKYILQRIAQCAPGKGTYIGRSSVKGIHDIHYEFWFTNTNIINPYNRQNAEVGQIVELSKNSHWGRAILEDNVVGDVVIPRRRMNDLKAYVYNTSTFVQSGSLTTKIKVRLEENPDLLYQYPVLKQAFIDIAREEADREKIRREKEAELERQRKAAEAKLKEEELKRELARIEAEKKAAEEKERQEAEQRRKEYDKRIEEALAKQEQITQIAQFIRKQASLQKNPILAKLQNDIKFSHLYDGTALVITGGPGTGKTTTLIQRLQLLMDVHDMREDWDVNLNDEEVALLSINSGNWIFFSPTEQLRNFLRDNMDYEGLQRIEEKTFVWKDYLKAVVRDDYQLAGTEAPFSLSSKLTERMFANNLNVVNDFSDFYVDRLKNKLIRLSTIDCSKFEWKQIGGFITNLCKEANNCSSIKDIIRLLARLGGLSNQNVGKFLSVPQIIEKNTNGFKDITNSLLTKLRNDKQELYKQLLKWTEDNYKIKREEELPEGSLYDEATERQLNEKVRDVLRKLSQQELDETVKIENLEEELMRMIASDLNFEDLKPLSDSEYFRHYLYPIVRDYETFLLSDIPDAYKVFRRSMLKANSKDWNIPFLQVVVEEKDNSRLTSEEQALLVGFINNTVKQIKIQDPSAFPNLRHRYAAAYKKLCRPIIGVDEATDYSMIDYYGIASLRHYLRSAVTLSGDTMQCLQTNGITDWSMLRNELIFRTIDVKELNVSYRQSPKLLDLAKKLYRTVMNKRTAPYTCHLESLTNAPKPLWHESEDEEEKVEWIANRIEEVQKAYGELPLVAILVRDKDAAKDLEETLKDQFEDDGAGIDVVNCSNGELSSKNPVRIFPIDMVKGMEFQVVFFHDIDEVEHRELIDKYLYVGLSRATFFMGVTTSDSNLSGLADFSDSFDKKGNWEKYKPE